VYAAGNETGRDRARPTRKLRQPPIVGGGRPCNGDLDRWLP